MKNEPRYKNRGFLFIIVIPFRLIGSRNNIKMLLLS
jgi:hypothetical protein